MSLINDALKQARQAPPRGTPNSLPPLQPAAAPEDHSPAAVWLVPAIIIFLVFAAIFFIGIAAAHRTQHAIASAPQDPSVTQTVVTVSMPVATTPEPTPVPVTDDMPHLQGIFYSAHPTAIMDGKTIHTGDQFKQYKVKQITQYNVILTGADNKDYKIGLGN
jgi:hypothetical protein